MTEWIEKVPVLHNALNNHCSFYKRMCKSASVFFPDESIIACVYKHIQMN